MTRYSITMPLANGLARPDQEIYAEADRRLRIAEDLGYDTVFTNEHHFSDYTVCPDTMVFLAWAASRTSRIRLGTSVIVAPWHDPIRLAEQIAMLDVLSHGRVLPGLGRGTAIHEHRNLGVAPEETRERFAETIEVLRIGLSGEPFDYVGPFHRYEGVTVRPRPVRSEIPLIGASTSPASCEILGGMGLGLMLMGLGQAPATTLESLRSWEAALGRSGHERAALEASYHGMAFVADTDEEAYEQVAAFLERSLTVQVKHYQLLDNPWAGVKSYEYQAEQSAKFAQVAEGGLDLASAFCDQQLVGSPETVARRVKAFVAGGIDHMSFYVDWWGAIGVGRIEEQTTRMMQEVIPLVDEVRPASLEDQGVRLAIF